jgi:ABC-type uncharacterized transport system substrate-binding protein
MQRLGLWLRLFVFAGLIGLLGPAHAVQVCVVSGDRNPTFQEAADSLIQDLVRGGVARQDITLLSTTELAELGQAGHDTRLIVTLGTDALRHVASRNPKAAVIAGLIPRIAFERVLQESTRKNPPPLAALYLDQPLGRQIDLLRLALPAARRIGVLWGPESILQQSQLNAALSARGMELSEGLVSDSTSLITALRSALNAADALLAVADGIAFNPSTASNILLTSYRAKIPVMAFSPAYVKAGALLSVHSAATQAGTQLAAMATQFLQTSTLPASQYPQEFSITVNDYVAHSLGLTLDAKVLTERLRRLEKKP